MKRLIIFLGVLFLLLLPSFCLAKNFKDKPYIPILEYHSVGPFEARWTRSYENFKNDLLWLYNNDYALISASSFASMNFVVPEGKKPVVLTFDDGNENQFRYLPDGTIDSNCAVGILDEFYETHPEFGRAATFYVNSFPFGQEEYIKEKFLYLLSTDREIGNHTLNHADLSNLSAQETLFQLGGLTKKLTDYVGFSFSVSTLAYPHGSVPSQVDAMKSGEYEGNFYLNKIGLLVGAEPALLPTDEKFDPVRVPRIQAISDEWKRWFNRPSDASVDKVESENFKPYTYGESKKYPYHLCDDVSADQYILWKKMEVSLSSFENFLSSLSKKSEPFYPKGIYLATSSVTSDVGYKLVDKLKESGGNMVVFDVLPAGKLIPYPGDTKVDKEYEKKVSDFIDYVNKKGLYTVARYVLFKNPTIAAYKSGWLLKSKTTGGIWSGDGGPVWLDPSMPEVQDYLIKATKEIAKLDVREIQFDYVRFPTASNSKDTSYYAMRYAKGTIPNKWNVIRDFLKRVRDEFIAYDVKIGVDLYGIVAWNDGFDAYSTGQKIECLAPYVDVIYPMTYPSHFGPGFGGHKNPADEPYYFVKKSSELFLSYMKGTYTLLRPWLQGFMMRVTKYDSSYVPSQVAALKDLGVYEFVIWNAANVYDLHWGAFK